jgi:ATP-dependent Lhr-like helicase
VVFPDQLACLENIAGDREIPDHPLVSQTIRDCLEEAMDIDRLEDLLRDLRAGRVEFTARDLREPSPMSMEILNARPYAFLDDAPLEERRTQAVLNRRWLDPDTAADIGALDDAAIERVRDECWPQAENADELHDALVLLGALTVEEGTGSGWTGFFERLQQQRRATRAVLPDGRGFWVAVERQPQWMRVHPETCWDQVLEVPAGVRQDQDEEHACVELLRGRLETVGPVTAAALACWLDIPLSQVEAALLRLESEGFVLRGRFTPKPVSPGAGHDDDAPAQQIGKQDREEWCERRLLSRIHRYTLKRLRSEIEPVSAQDYMRFLLEWQHLTPQARMQGPGGVAEVLEQLEGIAVAAAAWEAQVLPARISGYDPAWLDQLCLSGKLVWARAGGNGRSAAVVSDGETPMPPRRSATPIRTTPIALFQRRSMSQWANLRPTPVARQQLSPHAVAVLDSVEARGASFFTDIVTQTGLLGTQVEFALAELVAQGVLTADGFTGLRALLVPSDKRRPLRARPGGRSRARFGIEDAGRWVTLASGTDQPDETDATFLAHVLLRRYGVVFRRVLEREALGVPWRDLLRALRRLEARGEIRGGRFVGGFTGEQYALPEAVGALRAVRRQPRSGMLVSLSASDPLNLVGILTPGERVPMHADNRILYEDGVPLAVRIAGDVRVLAPLDAARDWQVRQALVQQQLSSSLRSVLKHAG